MMNECEQFCRDHFNEPILVLGELARIIGYGETKDDCYILVKHERGPVQWQSFVGGYFLIQDALINNNIAIGPNGEIWDDLARIQKWLCAPQENFEIQPLNQMKF